MPDKPDSGARWNRVERLFHAALELPADRRALFLEDACGSDGDLRGEVESLLAAARAADSLLETPAIIHIAPSSTPGRRQPLWEAGTMIGPYRICERLGAGGMGEVFRALDTRLHRDVALKTLPESLSLDRSYVERLRREALALASVNHPNVATLYEIAEVEGGIALVMEVVEGETLATRLNRARLSLSETLTVALQIAAAVEAAHRKGVTHRDLKPGNVMITRGGLVKVLDFGLAKSRGSAPSGGRDATLTFAATEPGAILGTAGYMSPEQAEGVEVDSRTDIFSFGAILYEMTAGRKAFHGDTSAQMLASVLRDEAEPPQRYAPGAPKPLVRLIRACLRKDRDERYQSISDVKLALQEIKDDLDHPEAPTVLSAWSSWRARAALTAVLSLALAGIWYATARNRGAQQLPVIVTPVATYPGFAQGPALSPDGKMLAFTWDGEHQDNFDVYVKVVDSGEPLRLTQDPARELRPIWSPDGRTIAYSRLRDSGGAGLATETIFTVPVLGGPERMVGRGFASDWSPDGTTLLALVAPAGEPTAWVLVSVGDGSSRALTTTPPGSTMGPGRFSPDGRKAYFVEQVGPSEGYLREMDLAGGAPRTVPITGLRSILNFAWSGPGELVVSGTSLQSSITQLYRVPATGGSAQPLPFGKGSSGIDSSARSGMLAFSRYESSENIWRVGAWPGTDRQPRRWISSEMPSLSPAVSSAGNKIAFSSERSGVWTIWAGEADGSATAPIVKLPPGATAMVGSPAWSPDGREIAFDAYVGTYANILVAPVASGIARPLTQGNARNIIPAWSPDGKWIYYTSGGAVEQSIWRIPAAGGEPQQITHNGGYSVKISPDGTQLYYLKNRRTGELWHAPADGGIEEPLIRDFKSRNFWVLADGIYLLDPGVTEMSPVNKGHAKFYRFATKKIEDLGFETEKPINHYGICLSPDGKWLFYTQADRSGSNLFLVENSR